MNIICKGRSWPMPDAERIRAAGLNLEEALTVESQSVLSCLDRKPWEVTMSDRDGTVQQIRFLKVWFDLPQTVLFSAVSYLDHFLTRMKVHSKYLSCLSVSCLNVAAEMQGFALNSHQLVGLSQSKCSVKDMQRMSGIVVDKLHLKESHNNYRNSFDFLMIFLDIFRCIAVHLKIQDLLDRMLEKQQLATRLEILISNASCATFNPSLLSLSLIQFEMEGFLTKEIKSNYYSKQMFYLVAVIIELQCLSKMNANDQASCFANVSQVLKDYDKQEKSKHCQKMMWHFSTSTVAISNGYRKYCPMLNTVREE